uniref:hypothetical protein n=1 Tax=Pararhodobacter marinus TaxID=2184063 RepID=UPI0035593E3B
MDRSCLSFLLGVQDRRQPLRKAFERRDWSPSPAPWADQSDRRLTTTVTSGFLPISSTQVEIGRAH